MNANTHFMPGDDVRIRDEFQDTGDDLYKRTVVEAPSDSSRVLVRLAIPGWKMQPTAWIEKRMLELTEAQSTDEKEETGSDPIQRSRRG